MALEPPHDLDANLASVAMGTGGVPANVRRDVLCTAGAVGNRQHPHSSQRPFLRELTGTQEVGSRREIAWCGCESRHNRWGPVIGEAAGTRETQQTEADTG